MKRIASFVKDAKSVLDLGCSVRQNAYLINDYVVGTDLEVVEPISNYNKMVVADVYDLPQPFKKESFEAITAGELIEHLDNPMLFLKKCFDTLKPDGVLVISTPNPNSIPERILTLTLSRKYYYDPEHVSLYPQRWLVRMFEKNNFIDVKVHSGGFTIPFLKRTIPFPRPWAQYSIVTGRKRK